jgi:hypothetical protein
VVDKANQETMQVIVYDLQRKEVRRSAEFPWAKDRRITLQKEMFSLATGAFWTPGDRLVIHDLGDWLSAAPKTGIYDLGKKRMLVFDGLPIQIEGTPIRPDAKGFLMQQVKDAKSPVTALVFVLWDGTEQKIQMPADSEKIQMLVGSSWFATSSWLGNTAVLGSGTNRTRIDTDKRIATFEAVPKPEATVNGNEIVRQYTFPDGARWPRQNLAEL